MMKSNILITLLIPIVNLVLTGCKDEPVETIYPEDLFIVSIIGDSIIADGISSYLIEVAYKYPEKVQSTVNKINLTTEPTGTVQLTNGGIFNSDGIAKASVSSKISGSMNIICTLEGLSANNEVTFEESYPDKMNIKSDKDSYNFDNLAYIKMVLTASFSKDNNGAVSDYPEYFSEIIAVDSLGIQHGIFINPQSNTDHTLSITYLLQDTIFSGILYFTSKCPINNDNLTASYVVTVNL